MTDADWEICPRTTNAVEAHNKISNSSHSSLLIVNLENWYRIDKNVCYDTIAAAAGVPVGVSLEKREKRNAVRRKKINQPKLCFSAKDDLPEEESSSA